MTATTTTPSRPVEVRGPQLLIDGRLTGSAEAIDVVDPSTGQVLTTVPAATPGQLDVAVAAARRAAPGWAGTPVAERQERVRAFAAVVRENVDELAALVTCEVGKPLFRARSEVSSGLAFAEAYTRMTLDDEVIHDGVGELVRLRRVPVGVAAAITAWNYPLMLALCKIGPALVAGNPVLVKPSPYTPVATLRLGELVRDVLPAGVFQVLAGGDGLGVAMTTHPGIDKVSFTGSGRAGRAILAATAPTVKRVTLEMGGNDAGIVLPDADPGAIAADLYAGGMSNCGQVCAGLKRLFVPASRAGEYADAIAAVAAGVVVGDGFTDGVDMGPVQNAPQLRRVQGLLADAVGRGAEVYFRGEAPDGPGYWHPVTLVRGAGDDVPLVAEEQFGPVLPLLTYDTVDEAVARANATTFGLGASVWSPDLDAAERVALRLDAGSVWVNQHPMLSPDTPFGGRKQSGLGSEGSLLGLHAYTDVSVLRIKRGAA
ncbi:aldehyde dehydrogenase family protein [Pseudonocardia sp.]|uniref:aldehyde dehydrogenase family protein n=1 Tax=Pseudonocardia sp. TaxID=60912 RepID=UPI003D09E04B